MHGKTAVITGASRGIGAAIARRLLFEGANVVLFARDEKRLHAVAGVPYEQSGRALVVAGAVTSRHDRAHLLEVTLTYYQHLDLLVSCAGMVQFQLLSATTEQSLQQQFVTNVFAPLLLTRGAVLHMRDGGSVLFITSSLTEHGFAGLSTYAATKGALRSFAKTLAVELAPRNIAVNTIAPGPTETELWSNALSQETLAEVRAQIQPRLLTGTFGTAEAIAQVVVMLAQTPTIRVDCGYATS